MIYIGADHRGYKLKEYIKEFLKKEGRAFVDVGAKKYVATDDYPDYVKKVAQKISKKSDADKGILICGSGQGICMAANRFKYLRAALAWSIVEAKQSREHQNSNVLCLSADSTSPHAAKNIVDTWLETKYTAEPRHARRIKEFEKFGK